MNEYPLTELAQTAAAVHELYVEFVKAGFAPDQAIYLAGKAMMGNQGRE